MANGSPRSNYVYTSDTGALYILSLADDLVDTVAQSGLPLLTNQAATPKPQRFKPRGVYWQGTDGARKFFVCGTTAATYYATNTPQSISIESQDGGTAELGVTTGRKGEQISF